MAAPEPFDLDLAWSEIRKVPFSEGEEFGVNFTGFESWWKSKAGFTDPDIPVLPEFMVAKIGDKVQAQKLWSRTIDQLAPGSPQSPGKPVRPAHSACTATMCNRTVACIDAMCVCCFALLAIWVLHHTSGELPRGEPTPRRLGGSYGIASHRGGWPIAPAQEIQELDEPGGEAEGARGDAPPLGERRFPAAEQIAQMASESIQTFMEGLIGLLPCRLAAQIACGCY